MSRRLQLQTAKDFRGGLNLRADPFELAANESPDLLNVDLDPRGGVEQRRGIKEMPVTVSNPNLFTVDESTAETSDAVMTNLTRGDFSQYAFVANGVGNSWKLTIAAPGTVLSGVDRAIAVLPSIKYSGTTFVKGGVASRTHTMRFDWYTSAMVFISSSTSAAVAHTADAGAPNLTLPAVRLQMTATSPSNAAFCRVVISTASAAVADTIFLGALYFAKGQNDGGYLRPETTTSFDSEVQAIFRFEKNGDVQTLVGTNESVWLSTNLTSWEQINYSPYGNYSSALQFKDKLYIFNSSDYTRTWDGTNTGIITGQAWKDSLADSSGSNMVFCQVSAVFQGSLWIANTNEPDARHPNRVRWSHPNFPEAYRSFDYIDVDVGASGDYITALVPYGDKLLVFKQRSMYAIVGNGPETFAVYPISTTVGTMHRFAVTTTPHGVYFFSWPEGVFLYDGKQLTWQFSKLKALVDAGHLPSVSKFYVRVGWSGRRLWVACEYLAKPTDTPQQRNNRCYIMDPSLSKEGSWTVYTANVSVMRSVPFTTGPDLFIGGSGWSYPAIKYLQVLEDPSNFTTFDTNAAGSQLHISSYFTTPWMDQGTPTIKKRFRTPEFVLRTVDIVTTLPVELRVDYADARVERLFNLYTKIDPNVMLWGTGLWGQNWQLRTLRQSEVDRGSPLGLARAVQLKISGPATNDHWGLNALTLKYLPRPPRN